MIVRATAPRNLAQSNDLDNAVHCAFDERADDNDTIPIVIRRLVSEHASPIDARRPIGECIPMQQNRVVRNHARFPGAAR